MFDSVIQTERPTEVAVLDRARTAKHAELAAAADLLHAAAQWAELHPCPTEEAPAGWGEIDLHGERVVTLAGPGAPLVAEFAPATLAAHLGLTLPAGKQLIGEALELAHRLPRLWGLVAELVIPAWKARQVAGLTMDLPMDQARWVDQMLAVDPTHLTFRRAHAVVAEAVLYADPDRAGGIEQAELDHRSVEFNYGADPANGGRTNPAVARVHMVLDTDDAQRFEARIVEVAVTLGHLGDPDTYGVRRAKAVGVLAHPQTALDLLCHLRQPLPRPAIGNVELVVHLDTTTTEGASVEGHGPVTRAFVDHWLAEHLPKITATGRITVRPVLDLANPRATDAHRPPARMRAAAVLADATCVFPACTRDFRHCDLDHITHYVPIDDGGPPGQTRLTNLAPLCRTHHRLKTHAVGWTYQRTATSTYLWTTPEGRSLTTTTRRRQT